MSLLPTTEIDQIPTNFQGRMGYHIEDLNTGTIHQHNATQRFPTASVIKIAVMLELYTQVNQGRHTLDDRHRLEGDIATHGSGTLSILKDAPELTLRDFCRIMITVSDNSATDFLMNLLSLDAINATLDELGYSNIRASMTMGQYHFGMAHMEHLPCTPENEELFNKRMAEGAKDYNSVSFSDSLKNNVASPAELVDLLKRLQRGELVSPQASADMIDMLKLCNDRRMLNRDLDRSVEIAHKSGSSGRIKGNAGIVYLPSGPLVIATFALASNDEVNGGDAIGDVSRRAIEALSPECIAK